MKSKASNIKAALAPKWNKLLKTELSRTATLVAPQWPAGMSEHLRHPLAPQDTHFRVGDETPLEGPGGLSQKGKELTRAHGENGAK